MLFYERDSSYKQYFEWLVRKVGGAYYENLLYLLWRKPFMSTHELDTNRAIDGLRLRKEFDSVSNGCCGCPGFGDFADDKKPCSVLEMMVALCIRCENEVVSRDVKYDRTPDWFHLMLHDLGLSNCTNSRYNQTWIRFTEGVLMDITNGQIKRDGSPYNWFVLPKIGREGWSWSEDIDFRKLDIWRQMLLRIESLDEDENIFAKDDVDLEVNDI